MKVGEVFKYRRKFTNLEVRIFGELTENTALVHLETDPLGRLMVQGLLTASLPIKIGTDLNLIGCQMEMKFVSPVYTEDTITCSSLIERIEEIRKGTKIWCSWKCTNQNNETVLIGSAIGIRIGQEPTL
ncbi:hotdog family protein [Desulfosporosinus shakirovi]|uniref:enoyl-CoA hydratase n=1 Tax=Desulfosporosinus shakirovi TaxID=2885154 RepID=UPI001E35EE15|nr:enoyl-CoA hydratase [Desulfosporosinus sp. SRJS8]MCB8817853.1 enoyl-CoA hydratase [Desulfosporosinus sp. SRJS8]